MGLSPAQIDDMSLYQFVAMVDGYKRGNSPSASPDPVGPEDMQRWATLH